MNIILDVKKFTHLRLKSGEAHRTVTAGTTVGISLIAIFI